MIKVRYKKGEWSENTVLNLPASKSISNRLLILRALYCNMIEIRNVSEARDTIVLEQCLQAIENPSGGTTLIDAIDGGTTFRFLTAYLSITTGAWFLTGSSRMKERPIGPLVDALGDMGATIEYKGKPGFPPLLIKGSPLPGGEVIVDCGKSSQFATALLLIAPCLENGLNLKVKNGNASFPYIMMTIELLKMVGIEAYRQGNEMFVPFTKPKIIQMDVEADWSSAAFWYEALCVLGKGSFILRGLSEDSIQGDSHCMELFRDFGIESSPCKLGMQIFYTNDLQVRHEYNLRNYPDIALPLIVAASVNDHQLIIRGLDNLQYKESDRVNAILCELTKLGAEFFFKNGQLKIIKGIDCSRSPAKVFDPHNDHRIAMSLAPLAYIYGEIYLKNAGVITKSYPDFWRECQKAGYTIQNTPES